MKHGEGILGVLLTLCLAVALLPFSIASANGTTTVSIEAPAEVVAGENFTANVTLDYVENFNSCGFDVVYDQSIITVTDVTGGEIDGHIVDMEEWHYIPVDTVDTGRIRVATGMPGMPVPGVNGTGYLAQIHFDVLGSHCQSSPINLETLAMYSGVPPYEEIPTTTENATVHVSGVPPTDAWVDDDWHNQTDVDIYNAEHGTDLLWQYDAFNIIQDAIDAVSSSTVHVLEGEYDSFLVEGRDNLNIIGEEAGAVVNNATYYPDWLCSVMAVIANSTDVNIEGLDFDGADIVGDDIEGITYFNSTGTIIDVTVRDIVGAIMGMGICIWGGEIDTVSIYDTTVEGCQIGVMVGEDQANIDYCTITGPAPEYMFSCGVMAMYGAVVNIENSDISDFWVEEPDPEVAGFGIMVGTPIVELPAAFGILLDDGLLSTVEVSDCSQIFNNNFGIYVYDDGDLIANGNNIEGNDVYGVYKEDPPSVDATENWWGDASGPGGVGPGTGDAVSDNVDYDPWLVAPCEEPVKELTAEFSGWPRTGMAPLRVQFTDETTGGVKPYSYEWDFGDGTTSTAKNPIHIYAAVSSYTVTLTVTDDVDETDPETKYHYIVLFTGEPTVGQPSWSISNLHISPEQAQPNQQVDISVNIANVGEGTGTYNAALYINGELENSETVGVAAGSTREVVFAVTRADPGTYDVSFAGVEGQFTVVESSWGGLDTVGIIVIVVVVIVIIVALIFLVPGIRKRD